MMRWVYEAAMVTGLAFLLTACGAVELDSVQKAVGSEALAVTAVAQPDQVENEAGEEETPAKEETMATEAEVATETPPAATMIATAEKVREEEMIPGEPESRADDEISPEEPKSSAGQESGVELEAGPTLTPTIKPAPTPSPEQEKLLASLPVLGEPPELYNREWLNSEPLKLADLQGKVVIVEFWTFGCINCINVIPSLREWHQEYQEEGLVIIGVHTPEFGYERDIDKVKEALARLDVPYPVAIDNDWKTWRAYNNRYWPAKYFIDKAGNIRHIHIGEGRYQEQEEIIQALLKG